MLNMFYTGRTPSGCNSGTKMQIGDKVCMVPGLPFGWVHWGWGKLACAGGGGGSRLSPEGGGGALGKGHL